MKAKAGDVFTIYNHYLNRYTACQITKVEPNGSAVCLPLDWSGPEPLGAHQLGGLKPLYKDFMYWPRCLRLCNVAAEVPSHYIYVGNRPSFCQESSDVYGPWMMDMRYTASSSGRRFQRDSAGYSSQR